MNGWILSHRWTLIVFAVFALVSQSFWACCIDPEFKRLRETMSTLDSLRARVNELPHEREVWFDVRGQTHTYEPAITDAPLSRLQAILQEERISHVPLRSQDEGGRTIVLVDGSGTVWAFHNAWRKLGAERRWRLVDWSLVPGDKGLVKGTFHLELQPTSSGA